MSLTTFLEHSDIRARFRLEFPKPKMLSKLELLAPPQSTRYGLVGTAFDYLLRFHVQRLNPKAINRRWVAEAAISKLNVRSNRKAEFHSEGQGVPFAYRDSTLDLARSIVRRAKFHQARYLRSGDVTEALLRSIIGLAQLDLYFRSGRLQEDLGRAQPEDVHDLRHLVDLVDSVNFRASGLCVLNPTFGAGSRLVRGADADLIIDETLIEIKTTKSIELRREYFNQLLGYFFMCKIWGIDGLQTIPKITTLGIYFARYGSMQLFAIDRFYPTSGSAIFLSWFKDSVKQWAEDHH